MLLRLILVASLTLMLARASDAQICAGDCGADGRVTVNELVQAVNIALERAALDGCVSVDTDGNQRVTVNELVVAVNNLVHGCNVASPTPTSSPTVTPGSNDQLPPTVDAELIAWLQAGSYRNWASEGQHPSSGPHFGQVRTFVNDSLFSSLDSASDRHSVGAAAVKELFGPSGSTVRGWGVSVRVADGSSGSSWYWFEYYNDNLLASGIGNASCTGCHSGGTDYVCSPYPLQAGGQTLPRRCP